MTPTSHEHLLSITTISLAAAWPTLGGSVSTTRAEPSKCSSYSRRRFWRSQRCPANEDDHGRR